MTSSNQDLLAPGQIVNNVILDFDGIFAADMIYTKEGKFAKSFPWGIRHSIDLLSENGFNVYIITGDSTGMGREVTSKFIKNLQIKDIIYCPSKDKVKYLKKHFDLNTCIYAGEDIYDLEIYNLCFSIVPDDAHNILKTNATFVSKYKTRDYFFMDLALNVLHHFKYKHLDPALMTKSITKDSTHEAFTDYLCNMQYRKIYILQQYSMRNHSDNLYNPLLDGNLNLTLHRIYNPLMRNDKLQVTISLPINSNQEQKEILIKFCNELYGENRVFFEEIRYGINAEQNRTELKLFNMPFPSEYDVIISDFSGVTSLKQHPNVIYNFNISRNATLDRWYVDAYFDDQYETIIDNLKRGVYGLTYVLNQNQKDYMINYTENYAFPIKSAVVVDDKIINTKVLHTQMRFYTQLLSIEKQTAIEAKIKQICNYSDLVLFMPFRLSDECYNFKGLLEYLNTCDKRTTIIITNPNDASYETFENVNIINISDEFKEINKKSLYFMLLSCINKTPEITIPIFEDPSVVLHQSILEMYALTSNCAFLDKNDFDFETLLTRNNKTYNKYLTKLIYENTRTLYCH